MCKAEFAASNGSCYNIPGDEENPRSFTERDSTSSERCSLLACDAVTGQVIRDFSNDHMPSPSESTSPTNTNSDDNVKYIRDLLYGAESFLRS